MYPPVSESPLFIVLVSLAIFTRPSSCLIFSIKTETPLYCPLMITSTKRALLEYHCISLARLYISALRIKVLSVYGECSAQSFSIGIPKSVTLESAPAASRVENPYDFFGKPAEEAPLISMEIFPS